MFYFTYKTKHENGKYYVGRHATKKIQDNYFGSGKWVRSIKDKSKLSREILEFFDTHEELLVAEKLLIEQNINQENCMNFNSSPVGFSSGELNPSCTPEGRKRISERVSRDGNPAKRHDVKKKMSESQKNIPRGKWDKPMSEEGRKNVSIGRTGCKVSEEGRKSLSESRKRQYEEGTREPPSFKGQHHTEETKKKMRKPKEIVKCPHCGKEGGISAMHRWHFEHCKSVKNRTETQ